MPPPRSPALELLVEQVARVVARARERQGEQAVRDRIAAAISPEDAETTARVLRILGRELGDAPVDLGALDARLRALAAVGDDAVDEEAPASEPTGRPHPPTGLRSSMRGRRR